MRKFLLFIIVILIISCKQKPSLTGNEPITFEEFSEVFSDLELPFTVSDTTLHKVADTTTISHSIFKLFVPDSVLQNRFGKDTSYKIKAVGKIDAKEKAEKKEDYLAVYAKGKQKAGIFLVVFNDNKFSAAMPLLETNKDAVFTTATIDKKLSINISKQWNKNNELMYSRTIYAYNNVGVFTTVLTETNVPRELTAKTVINPLDTMPKKNKYSGDYTKGKKNIVSIRDGENANTYLFFIHFLNDGENPCGGDLKGELKMNSENAGIYTASGDPCVIDFHFTKNQVKVKEQGSCGNYRGITCFFDDTYTRVKEMKQVSKK